MRIAYPVAFLAALALAACAAPPQGQAPAQLANTQTPPEPLKLNVTGSHIPQDLDQLDPSLMVIGMDQIDHASSPTMDNVLTHSAAWPFVQLSPGNR